MIGANTALRPIINNRRTLYYLCTVLLLAGLDQLSKAYLITYLKTQPGYVKEIFPFFDLVYAWNYGISFGLFREYYQYSNLAFLALNSIIIIYLIRMLYTSKGRLFQTGLILVIGGALGNLIDRIYRGAVFDFLYFHYQGVGFPAFNLADSFISIGACLIIYNYSKLS
ncbi:MAG: hypothetical protein Tsb006_5840 [Rickettsiaceae bacterium]